MKSDAVNHRLYGSTRLLVVLALSLVVAACGSGGREVESAAAAQDSTVAPEGSEAVLFVPTADGGQVDWNSLEGQDVVLWFWAPW